MVCYELSWYWKTDPDWLKFSKDREMQSIVVVAALNVSERRGVVLIIGAA